MNGSMLESKLLETHFDVIPFGIYVTDVVSREIIFVNRHFRDSQGDVIGRVCHEALYDTPQPCHFCKIKALVTPEGKPNGKTYVFELFNERDDRWFQVQEKAMSWPDGRTVKYSIAVDITELKETQNRLAEAHARLAIQNKDLSSQNELLRENVKLREHVERITRHDLKSPLTALVGLPDLLLTQFSLPPEAKRMVRMIERSSIAMLNMINRSLDMYKLEAGTYELSPAPVDLAALVRKAAALLAHTAELYRQTIDVTVNGRPAGENDEVVVSGEELLLQTMVLNLLQNAIEASPPGGRVTVSLDSGPPVVLTFANLGEAPEGVRERFFEKYVTAGKRGGTGLGTYSARLAAEAHGGSIELDLTEPGTVVVRVRFPETVSIRPPDAPDARTDAA